MAIAPKFRAETKYGESMKKKANANIPVTAAVGNGDGVTATVVGRANFYWIRLINDDNRLTQCFSILPLAYDDVIYVARAKDRKLSYYDFVAWVQDAGGGTTPPVQLHNLLSAAHPDTLPAGVVQGDVIRGDGTPDFARLAIGNAHEIFKVNAAGTDPNWEPFDWDEMATPGGADMAHDHSAAAEGDQNLRQILELEFQDAALLTINAGTVTRTQVYHYIAAEAGVADNLDNVLGGVEGDELVIRPDTGDTITCRHDQGGAGDFWFAGAADIVLDDQDHLRCIHDGTSWCDQSGGAGGGGGGGTLDQAYDFGGAGVGRTIIADAGAVQLNDIGGLGSQGPVVLDDGVGDSPELRFVGGSNDDTAKIWVQDDAIAGASDLIIQIPGGGNSEFEVWNSTPNVLMHIDGAGNAYFDGPSTNVIALTVDTTIGLAETADPANAANTGFVYTKDDAGDTELYYEDDGGLIAQLTEDGDPATAVKVNKNLLLNGNFNVWQQLATFTAATTPANNDDTYTADQYILLSDGNDIADVSQQAGGPDGSLSYLQALVATINKKFGFLQVLESYEAIPFRNRRVSLSFQAKTTAAAINNVRAAVITWTGAADAVTSDVVSAWNAAGVDPTLVANWTYENAPSNLALTANWQTFTIENINLDTANFNNVGVFIWIDDTDAAANDILHLAQVQLEAGAQATRFVPYPYDLDLWKCQRHFESIGGEINNTALVNGMCYAVNGTVAPFVFRVKKRIAPAVSYQTAVGDFSVTNSGSGLVAATAISFNNISTNSMNFQTGVAGGLVAGDATNYYTTNTNARVWIDARL